MNEVNTFAELLNRLSGAGAVVLVAWFASWVLEGWNTWDVLNSKVKSAIILALSILIGLLAVGLKSLPPEVVAALEPYVQTVLVVIGVWLTTQTAHRLNSLRK